MKNPDQHQSSPTTPDQNSMSPVRLRRFSLLAPVLFSALILATGCASGTHKVTGTLRTPVDADSVAVYHSMPEHARTIGIISAASYHGMTVTQADADVLLILKQEAARMGANGIVVSNVDDKPLDGARDGAKAIFVSR